MKSRISLTFLSLLLLSSAVKVLPQQAVPAEKKRVMSKFDPTDIFPEAKERGGKDRTRREKNPATANPASDAPPASPENDRMSRRKSRRRSSAVKPEVNLAANLEPIPPPAVSATPASAPSNLTLQKAEPTPAATTFDSASSSGVPGGTTVFNTPQSSQSLSAPGNSSGSSAAFSSEISPSRNTGLSLPVILTLLSLVVLALIFALARLMKQFRRSVN